MGFSCFRLVQCLTAFMLVAAFALMITAGVVRYWWVTEGPFTKEEGIWRECKTAFEFKNKRQKEYEFKTYKEMKLKHRGQYNQYNKNNGQYNNPYNKNNNQYNNQYNNKQVQQQHNNYNSEWRNQYNRQQGYNNQYNSRNRNPNYNYNNDYNYNNQDYNGNQNHNGYYNRDYDTRTVYGERERKVVWNEKDRVYYDKYHNAYYKYRDVIIKRRIKLSCFNRPNVLDFATNFEKDVILAGLSGSALLVFVTFVFALTSICQRFPSKCFIWLEVIFTFLAAGGAIFTIVWAMIKKDHQNLSWAFYCLFAAGGLLIFSFIFSVIMLTMRAPGSYMTTRHDDEIKMLNRHA